MRSAISLSLAVVALIFGIISSPLWSQSSGTEPHDFRSHGMTCRTCHKEVGIKASGALQKPVGDICAECHKMGGRSHPVDIKPSFAMPAGLPLDEQGYMTCATCHDPHRPYLNAVTGARSMYLRRDGPRKFLCLTCHAK